VFGEEHNATGYLLVFGKANHIDSLDLKNARALNRQYHRIAWEASIAKYAARWYRVV